MTIFYFPFLGNCRVSVASTAGAELILVKLFPRNSVRSDEFRTFKNISFLFPKLGQVGVFVTPP